MIPLTLKDRNKEELNKAHINIVKRVQGLQQNTRAIVPLGTLKWTG